LRLHDRLGHLHDHQINLPANKVLSPLMSAGDGHLPIQVSGTRPAFKPTDNAKDQRTMCSADRQAYEASKT
jgi:hypothetical protein